MKKYKGKIYWIRTKIEGLELLPVASAQTVDYSYLENIEVTVNHFQFDTEPYESEKNPDLWTPYSINLKSSNTNSYVFQGGYSKLENDTLISDTITCELFTNQKGLMLHGQWNQDKKHYLFWVHLIEEK